MIDPREICPYLFLGNKWFQIPTLSCKDLIPFIFFGFSKEEVLVFATTTWIIWYARNKLRYEGECLKEDQIVMQAL